MELSQSQSKLLANYFCDVAKGLMLALFVDQVANPWLPGWMVALKVVFMLGCVTIFLHFALVLRRERTHG